MTPRRFRPTPVRHAGRTLGAWAAVHAIRPAAVLLGVVAAAAPTVGPAWLPRVGPVELLAPVSVLLLLPAVAGVAVAVAADNGARLPLPDPARAVAARAGWVVAWTLLGVAVVTLGQLAGAGVPWEAAARNVVLHAALGLAVVTAGYASLAWLPSFGYLLVCLLFGFPAGERRYYWWAVVLQEHVSPAQVLWVAALYAAALAGYALGAHRGRALVWRLRGVRVRKPVQMADAGTAPPRDAGYPGPP